MTNTNEVTFQELEATDVVSIDLVPERKGIILKHCEYYVSSRRHGTTVTRRYNDFVQLYDVLFAKYPYRAVCQLPPKRVVVGGGSGQFLESRRAALQRWLSLAACHPILAHDADLRTFLSESVLRLEKPKHDEFVLAGTQCDEQEETPLDEMKARFAKEQEQLRILYLGMDRLAQIFDRVKIRCEAEKSDFRELGAALQALSTRDAADTPLWTRLKQAYGDAALVCTGEMFDDESVGSEAEGRVSLARDALAAGRELCTRLGRGLHAERAAAAALAPPHAQLRRRHLYALTAVLQEACVWRAYAAAALQALGGLARARGAGHARAAAAWARLHAALPPAASAPY